MKNKKVLITGIKGFIGSNCAKYFEQKGYEVFGIDIVGEKTPTFLQGEVDLNNLKSFNQKFDVIIHLAGSGTVGLAQKCPELEYTKTVGSTNHILEYIKNYNSGAKLIYASSAAVYGDLYSEPIKEYYNVNPISNYGQHKVEAENLCRNYHKNFGLDINIIRFFSIYGEGLKKQLLWDFSNRIMESIHEKSLHCFGTGEETRDFIHISDALLLIELLINKGDKFQILNGATGVETNVVDVLTLLSNELNFTGKLVFDNIIKEGDPKSLIANIDKAKELGFSPKIDWIEGMKRYVNWFRQNN